MVMKPPSSSFSRTAPTSTRRIKGGGWTPLSYGAEHGHEAIVKQLLENSADVNPQDKGSRPPLSYVADVELACKSPHRLLLTTFINI
jgi:ankyrin repeat protein